MRKIILAATAAVAAMGVAPAANASVAIVCPGNSGLSYCTFDQVNKTGTFGDSFPTAQNFTDTFTLILSSAYTLSITATNTAATGGPISFTTAALLNSSNVSLGNIAFGAVPTTFALTAGTYTLKFDGTASASSSFGGTIDIKPAPRVPEPATWGMMLVGAGVVGASLRRRARTVAFS